jgi:hypothetical protein
MANSTLEQSFAAAANRFARELLSVLKQATLAELTQLSGAASSAPGAPGISLPRKPGRPPGSKNKATPSGAAAPAAASAAAQGAAKGKGGRGPRARVNCARPGCKNTWYYPSGKDKRLCYKHFVEVGGRGPAGKVAAAAAAKK